MSTTAGGFPLMAQTQSSRYLTYNELAWAVDVLQRGVIDRDLTAPPGSPAEGDAYIVASGATGAWAGQDDSIAFYFGGVWNFLGPQLAQGNGVYLQDDGIRLRWNPDLSPAAYEPLAISSDAPDVTYSPSDPSDWGSPLPNNVAQALDELAQGVGGSVSTVNGISPSMGDISLNGGHIGVKGADIASAATVDLATATGDWVDVTGTTTITALGTVVVGVERLVRFTGILTLTHNGTSLILPTGANITTAAGDFARFRSLGSGNWVCVAYQRADGTALAASASALQGSGLDVDAAGFRGIPQNAQTGNYTTVAADAGKHLYHASGAGAGDTYTIDSNANVAYEIGTAITFVNMSADTVAIAITSDTMYLAGTGTTGTRTLAQYGIATAIKLTSTTWIISGTGLT